MRLFAFALLFAGCGASPTALDLGVPPDGHVADGPVFEHCNSICVRPSDCAVAYPDVDHCPSGFTCAARFGSCD